MARADVLRSAYRALERYAPLAQRLGHTVGAATITAGARIIGDSVHIERLPLPVLILGFEGGDAQNPDRDMLTWDMEVWTYANDVFEAADILDLIEGACNEHTLDPSAPQPLNLLRAGPHQRLEPDTPQGRIIAVRMTITASWAKGD